jgi:hypothetical protein
MIGVAAAQEAATRVGIHLRVEVERLVIHSNSGSAVLIGHEDDLVAAAVRTIVL